jgi:hypothetical protein
VTDPPARRRTATDKASLIDQAQAVVDKKLGRKTGLPPVR